MPQSVGPAPLGTASTYHDSPCPSACGAAGNSWPLSARRRPLRAQQRRPSPPSMLPRRRVAERAAAVALDAVERAVEAAKLEPRMSIIRRSSRPVSSRMAAARVARERPWRPRARGRPMVPRRPPRRLPSLRRPPLKHHKLQRLLPLQRAKCSGWLGKLMRSVRDYWHAHLA